MFCSPPKFGFAAKLMTVHFFFRNKTNFFQLICELRALNPNEKWNRRGKMLWTDWVSRFLIWHSANRRIFVDSNESRVAIQHHGKINDLFSKTIGVFVALWEDMRPMTYYMIWMRSWTNQSQIQPVQNIPLRKEKTWSTTQQICNDPILFITLVTKNTR